VSISKQVNILDLNYLEMNQFVISLGEPAYRTDQLLTWIYKKLINSFEEMSDLPKSFRQKLSREAALFTSTPLEERVSSDGLTRKILLSLDDAKTIESTLMMYEETSSARERRTVCVSTQVGCPMGCLFCATGQQGFERNLRPGEIIEQVLYFMRLVKIQAAESDNELVRRPVTNVVFMGMGEPLANYENVKRALVTLNSKQGLELGARQLTLSTSGLVPEILQLADEELQVELAVSLHAPSDDLRSRMMPVNRKYPLAKLIPACRVYFQKTGRRPTFEYALFAGVNDSLENARQLALLVKGLNCSINLIVGNPTGCREHLSSTLSQARAFQQQLSVLGIASTIRVSRGTDIDAGCGQLKSRFLN
jgi:23S rRNA (adenine2503-C2)-methyltransferase